MPTGDFPPHPLEASQALALIRIPDTRYRSGDRDRAMLAIMWRCGLRCAEICDLMMGDITHGEPRTLTVLRPKGFRKGAPPRTVGLDPQTYDLIIAWVSKWRGFGPGYLFTTRNHQQISTRHTRRMVARRASQAGLSRRTHPHCLRHTFARNLYDEGVGMVHIQKALGHTTLATTAKYLESIGCSEVVAVTSARNWRI